MVTGYATAASADAVIVTRAMKASTIMEAFVELEVVRVELEIGKKDEPAFTKMIEAATSAKELPTGLPPTAELTLSGDGKRLRGDIVRWTRRKRIVRDEITGEPVGASEADEVLFVELRYPLTVEPKRLTLRPPTKGDYAVVDLGFVLYHQGIAVNDFRYLSASEMAKLDWDDPFYSAFDRRTLRRTHYAPMNVFVYIEPFEVRKEFVVRPVDLARFMGVRLDMDTELSPKESAALLEQMGAFLTERAAVTIDGKSVEPILDRIHFLKRGLRMTRVVLPGETVPARSAIVGAIFVYPVPGLPQEVRLTWDLFDDRIQRVPVAATDEAGPMPSFLTPADPELKWVNYLKNPTQLGALEVQTPASQLAIPTVLTIAIVLAVVLILVAFRQRSTGPLLVAAIVLLAGWAFRSRSIVTIDLPTRIRIPSSEEASPTIRALLYNVYRALDLREEEVVFDRLANSLAGDVLERVYLEMRRGLRLESQGGARVRVREVDMLNVEPAEPVIEGGLGYRCVWNATGSVGHWGHTHLRTNQYEALLTLSQFDDQWKIAAIDILEERRLPGQSAPQR